MRIVRVALLLSVTLLMGCTSARLRQRTIHQASTISELQFQQVLNNLAMFAENPSALPWHINLREGTTQITDSASGGAAVDLGPPAATLPQLFGSRTVVAQWGVTPVVDPTELSLLRFAYRRAHGSPEMPTVEFLNALAHELKDQVATNEDLRDESALFFQELANLKPIPSTLDPQVITTNNDLLWESSSRPSSERSPLARDVLRRVEGLHRDLERVEPGWFHVGRKRDVPRDACYVGRSGDSYAWVCADGREALTQFTLTVLKFSSVIKETQTLLSPGSVKFSPGDRG